MANPDTDPGGGGPGSRSSSPSPGREVSASFGVIVSVDTRTARGGAASSADGTPEIEAATWSAGQSGPPAPRKSAAEGDKNRMIDCNQSLLSAKP